MSFIVAFITEIIVIIFTKTGGLLLAETALLLLEVAGYVNFNFKSDNVGEKNVRLVVDEVFVLEKTTWSIILKENWVVVIWVLVERYVSFVLPCFFLET